MTRTEAIQHAHARYVEAAARARRDFTAARALRPDLRRAREREVADAQSRAFGAFTAELESHLEALRAQVRDARPSTRLVRALLEQGERRERARAAADLLRTAPLSVLRDLAVTAARETPADVGMLGAIRQVLDGRDGLSVDDPEVCAVRAALESWALADYEAARAELLLAQGLAARARLGGPFADAPASLFGDPARYLSTMRDAAVVEAEALGATPFTLADVEGLLAKVPAPAATTPAPDDYDPDGAGAALTLADVAGLPRLEALRTGAATA